MDAALFILLAMVLLVLLALLVPVEPMPGRGERQALTRRQQELDGPNHTEIL